MSDEIEQAAAAKAFAEKHMAECVDELLEWEDTGILRDGKVRELAQLCSYAGYSNMNVARALVNRAAFNRINTLGFYS